MRALCILVLQYMHIATATVPLHALPLFLRANDLYFNLYITVGFLVVMTLFTLD